MPTGYFDTRFIDFPQNVDKTYLRNLQTRAGLSLTDILGSIDNALGTFNTSLDPLVSALISPTTEATAPGARATAFEVQERGEYAMPRPQVAEILEHMLPFRKYDVSTAFTEDGLEEASLEKIMVQVDSILLGLRRKATNEVLNRLFSNAEVRVGKNTTATSPGLAGSGTGENAFTGAYPDGQPLEAGYTHYYFANTTNAGELNTVLKGAVARLRRWHDGPFDLIAPQAKLDQIMAIPAPDFVSAGSTLVRPGQAAAEALVDPATYIGVYNGDVRVRKVLRNTSSPVISIFKSYGNLDPRNPLKWRWDQQKGRDATIRYRDFYPLSQSVVRHDYGIGVGDRTSAVNITADAGATAYVNPTFA